MLKVGCQTYTWEMLGPSWRGSVDGILDAVAGAGYGGIEITNSMIREYADRPKDFAKAIERRGLSLAAFAYASPAGLTDPDARAAEIEGAAAALQFVSHFPDPVLALGGASSPDRSGLDRKIGLAADFYNEIGRLAQKAGVRVAFISLQDLPMGHGLAAAFPDRHAVAVEIEHQPRGSIEAVVVRGWRMAEVAHIGGKSEVLPAFAGKGHSHFWHAFGHVQEILAYPFVAVR